MTVRLRLPPWSLPLQPSLQRSVSYYNSFSLLRMDYADVRARSLVVGHSLFNCGFAGADPPFSARVNDYKMLTLIIFEGLRSGMKSE
jgi:hypothetical protein